MKHRFELLKALLFSFFFIVCSTAHSQEYDLISFVNAVKENNIELKQSNNQIEVAKQDLKVAKSYLLPNIAVDGYYQRDFNNSFLFINDLEEGQIKFRTNFNNSVNVDAVLSQTIFDPTIFSSIKMIKLTEELGKLNNEHVHNELITQASSMYWQAVFAKESLAVLKENENLAKEQLDQVQILFKQGVVSELQVQQVETLYMKTIPSLKNAQNQYNNFINELKVLASIPVTNQLILVDDLKAIKINRLNIKSDVIIEQQPQLQVLKKEIEIAEKQISANQQFWLPKLNLSSFYSYNAQDDKFNFKNNENKVLSGRLGLSIPIFSGGRNKAEIAKSKIEREIAEFDLTKTRQNLLMQLQNAENSYNSAIENIALRKETISLNEKEIEIFNKQLSLGFVTPIEFKESRVRLTQTRLELLNDYLDLQIAQLQITRILGAYK